MYVGENEGTKFWLQVLTGLQNRGLQDIFIACIDNLRRLADAIESIFLQTEVQLCIVHQAHNSQKYLSYKDVKPFMKDLQSVCRAATAEQAELNLSQLEPIGDSAIPKLSNPRERTGPA